MSWALLLLGMNIYIYSYRLSNVIVCSRSRGKQCWGDPTAYFEQQASKLFSTVMQGPATQQKVLAKRLVENNKTESVHKI